MIRFVNLLLAGITGGAVLALVALAVVMTYRATRTVNFAQGAMLMLTTFVGWTIQQHTGSYWLALVGALGAGLVLASLTEMVLVRPVEDRPELNAVVVTLGLAVLIKSAAGMIWGSTPRSYPVPFSLEGFTVAGAHVLLSPSDLFTIAMVALAMTALVLLFRCTTLGLQLRAGAYAPEASRLLGVRVSRLLTIGWGLSGVLGSLAGVLTAPVVFLGPDQFDTTLVYAFAAAIIGGLESPVGAVLGGLFLGCVLSFVSGYAGSETTPLGAFIVLLGVLALRPEGVLGPKSGRNV